MKLVFVDYLGDVTLYTTADENSAFFATRLAILREATRRVRLLVKDSEYDEVVIVGHSLGSVIAYDVINWLRTEAQVATPFNAEDALKKVAELAKKLPQSESDTALDLLDQIKLALLQSVDLPRSVSDQLQRAVTLPVTEADLKKLKTFVTFGSPLNKVLYFFRSKIKVYETIRSHIVQELHGYRQQQNLLTRDPGIRDAAKITSDNLVWLNFHSVMDPVSGRLVFYDRVNNQHHWYLIWGYCHMSYWHDPKMYRAILGKLMYR